MKKVLSKIHFSCLLIIILNVILKYLIGVSFLSQIELGLKLIIVATGLVLFFQYLKITQKIKFYFSIYVVLFFLLILSVVFQETSYGSIASAILYPIHPDDVECKKDKIIVYNHYQGFLGRCCPYRITEVQGFIFEKDYGIIQGMNEIDFQKSQLTKVGNAIEVRCEYDFLGDKKDTTIILIGK